MRCEFSAGETFRRLQDHLLRSGPLLHESDWQRLKGVGEATGEDASVSVLAHDVIKFELKALEQLVNQGGVASQWPESEMPAWVDMTLRVTNRQTGRWLRTIADWRGQGERSQQITNGTEDQYNDDPEVRTFSMRLRLPAQVW
jgi:hypothetical protein